MRISINQYLILGNIFFFTFAQYMVIVLVPLVILEFVTNALIIGFVFAIPGFISIIFEIPIAGLSDYVARKPIFTLGAICGAIGVISIAFITNLTTLIFMICMTTLASAIFFPPALAYLSEVTHTEEQPRLQGINGFIQGVAAFIGALLVGALAENMGFSAAFFVIVFIYIINIVFSLSIREAYKAKKTRYSFQIFWGTYKSVIGLIRKNGKIQMATLVEILYAIAIMVIGNSFFPLYVATQLGKGVAITGSLISTRNLTSTGVSLLFGRTAKRIGIEKSLIITLSIASLTLFLIPYPSNIVILFLLIIIQGAGVGFIPAAPNVYIANGTLSNERAVGYASVTFFSRVAQIIFSVFFGIIAQGIGISYVFPIGGLICTLLIILFLRKDRKKDNHSAEQLVSDWPVV